MTPDLTTLDPWMALAGVAVCFVAAVLGSVAAMGAGMIVTLFITPIRVHLIFIEALIVFGGLSLIRGGLDA